MEYHITGILVNGRRFRKIVTSNPVHAFGINVFRGSKWEVVDGKRRLLIRVRN